MIMCTMTIIQVKMNKYDQLYMLQQMQVLTTAQMPQYYPVLVFAKLHQLGCVGFAQKHVSVSSESIPSSKITQKPPELHGKLDSPARNHQKSMKIPWKTMKSGGVSWCFNQFDHGFSIKKTHGKFIRTRLGRSEIPAPGPSPTAVAPLSPRCPPGGSVLNGSPKLLGYTKGKNGKNHLLNKK